MAENTESGYKPIVVFSGVKHLGIKDQRQEMLKDLADELITEAPPTLVPIPRKESSFNFRNAKFINKLEKSALPQNKVPLYLRDFVENAGQYFNQVAKKEGYIREEEKYQQRVVFVPNEKWDRVMPKKQKYVEGLHDVETGTIYIKGTGGDSPSEQFFILMRIAHEMRHRIGRTRILVHFREDKKIDRGMFLPEIDSFHPYPFEDTDSVFDEMFVRAWIQEHVKDIPNKKFQNLYRQRLRTKDGEEDGYSTLTTELRSASFDARVFYLETYYLIKQKIPNFLDLCAETRQAKPGAKENLAKQIVQAYGKRGLAALCYGQDDEKSLVNVWSFFDLESKKEGITTEEWNEHFKADQDRSLKIIFRQYQPEIAARLEKTYLSGENSQKIPPLNSAEELAENVNTVVTKVQMGELQKTRVVDEFGRPKLVYRGTMEPNKFKDSKAEDVGDVEFLYGPGTYFTEDSEVASQYANREGKMGGAVYPAYLVVKHPIDIDNPPSEEDALAITETIERSFETHSIGGKTIRDYLMKEAPSKESSGIWDAIKYVSNGISGKEADGLSRAEIVKILRDAGFDGLTYEGVSLKGTIAHKCWVVFDESQIIPKFAASLSPMPHKTIPSTQK